MPMSTEYAAILKKIFGEQIGTGSHIAPPLSGAAIDQMKIGSHVFINSNLLAMARGGITIEDDVQIAGNVSLLSNNHDPYDPTRRDNACIKSDRTEWQSIICWYLQL